MIHSLLRTRINPGSRASKGPVPMVAVGRMAATGTGRPVSSGILAHALLVLSGPLYLRTPQVPDRLHRQASSIILT